MIELFMFSGWILLGVCCLVIWPVMIHPTLPAKRKIILSVAAFIVLVPLGIGLYVWLGVPAMAGLG